MRRITRLTDFALVFLCLLPGAPIAWGQAPPPAIYGVCWTMMAADGTYYYSAPFDGAGGDRRVWAHAFAGYLDQKYGDKNFAACETLHSEAEAQAAFERRIANARGQGQKIVETGWKYQ